MDILQIITFAAPFVFYIVNREYKVQSISSKLLENQAETIETVERVERELIDLKIELYDRYTDQKSLIVSALIRNNQSSFYSQDTDSQKN